MQNPPARGWGGGWGWEPNSGKLGDPPTFLPPHPHPHGGLCEGLAGILLPEGHVWVFICSRAKTLPR